MNARSLQANGYAYAVATGADDWTIQLTPAITTLNTAMKLMVKVPSDNTGPVTLTIMLQVWVLDALISILLAMWVAYQ